ncbi:MAG: nucleotidyltransferase family protein [Acidobacteriota bacterium]
MSQETEYCEERLLLDLLRADWAHAESLLKDDQLRRVPLDQERFQKLLKNSGTGAYIDWLIESQGCQPLFPPDMTNLFKTSRKKAKVDNAYILGILDKIIEKASGRKIDIILLKGADLVHRIYKSQELRHLDDIDLLIHPADLDEFLEMLKALDLKVPSGQELRYFKKASYTVECWTKSLFPCLFEVHWDLSQKFRYRVDMDEIWKNAETLSPFPPNVKFLKPEHLLIHLCLHLFHHTFHVQLKWHVDLKEILKKNPVDMDYVFQKSTEWSCFYSVCFALLYLKKLFPDLLHPSIFSRVRIPLFRGFIISRYYSENPLKFLESGGSKLVERMVRTIAIDRPEYIFLFTLNRLFRNPWVTFEED